MSHREMQRQVLSLCCGDLRLMGQPRLESQARTCAWCSAQRCMPPKPNLQLELLLCSCNCLRLCVETPLIWHAQLMPHKVSTQAARSRTRSAWPLVLLRTRTQSDTMTLQERVPMCYLYQDCSPCASGHLSMQLVSWPFQDCLAAKAGYGARVLAPQGRQ